MKINGSLLVGFGYFLAFTTFTSCQTENAMEPYLLGMGFGINSSILMVNDLETTRHYFEDTLGFSLSNKIDKAPFDGSIMTSAQFADMSFLKILSLNDTLADQSHASFISSFLENHEGVRLFELSTSSADSASQWLTSQGFKIDSLQSYRNSETEPDGWSRDDGSPQRRSLDFESTNPPAHYPRFVERSNFDYKFRQKEWLTFYNYTRRYNEHPNGVVGTAAILIAVEDMESASEKYKNMGFIELAASDTLSRYQVIRNQELHLISPGSTDDELSSYLQTHGAGVFALRFEVINLDSTFRYFRERLPAEALKMDSTSNYLKVDKEFAYGVQLEFVQESEEQKIMAQKLRPDDLLDSVAIQHAKSLFVKYCALCHGENGEGYAADHAPSLRSHSLLATSQPTNFMRYTIQFGRSETAMGGYLKREGGPLEYIEIEQILQWLYQTSGVKEPIELSREPVVGDVALGADVYANNCVTCHGENGEGITAPALGNPMLLATATDHFLRYAIAEGRDNTPMQAFKEKLSNDEIDAVTAFLRSRASGWNVPKTDTVTIPLPKDYVLNANSKAPKFTLREGLFVSAEQLHKAMQDSSRMIILDARSEVAWRQTHIPGSIPVPYYEEPENFVGHLPNDSTWIVAYCACPHRASEKVIRTLTRYGYKNTAILDEGILVWAQLGYPVQHGN
jgi:cbb3-type cytochrome c oxidase subunit III